MRVASLILIAAAAELAAAPGATDLLVRPPLPVAYPRAGGTYTDPSFGTRVLRVTDERHGRRCVHAYSYWPAFNSDATRILIACDDVPMLVTFDPEAGRVLKRSRLRGPAIQFEGASWSATHASTLYALDRAGRQLLRLNADTGAAVVLEDIAATFVAPAKHLTVSDGGTVFAFVVGGEVAVWRRAEDRIEVFPRPVEAVAVNEAQVNRAGGRVVVHYDDGRAYLWTLSTGRVVLAPVSTGHWDLGPDLAVNGDGIHTGINRRGYTLASWLAPVNILRYLRPDGRTPVWCIAEHISLRADEARAVLSTYGHCSTWAPFQDEIVVVRIDGSGFVRLAHTRSAEKQATKQLRYWAQPRATVSRDSRFVLWTSDLGSSERFDVLLLVVP